MDLVDMDCLHDEPNCGSCASCLARIAAKSQHEITYTPQPITDSWDVQCSCGWKTNVSGLDYPSMRTEAQRRADEHLKYVDPIYLAAARQE
jgi:hypothetical protein